MYNVGLMLVFGDFVFCLLQTVSCDRLGQFSDFEAVIGMGVKCSVSGLDSLIAWKPSLLRNPSLLPGMQAIKRM